MKQLFDFCPKKTMGVKERAAISSVEKRRSLHSLVCSAYSSVTRGVALEAHRAITDFHSQYKGKPPKEHTDLMKNDFDAFATLAGAIAMHELEGIRTIMKGSEGDKDGAESEKGEFGPKDGIVVHVVSDVIEGTTVASRLENGASSARAVVVAPDNGKDGIMKTPKKLTNKDGSPVEGQKSVSTHMIKLIGPRALNNAGIDILNLSPQENLRRALSALDTKPEDVTVVALDPKGGKTRKDGANERAVNGDIANAAKELGMNVQLINFGDFMPGLRAAMDPKRFGVKPVIVYTRGGIEEGTMAAAAAKALKGFAQGVFVDKDTNTFDGNKLLTLHEDLVPGDYRLTSVHATFITDDDLWFNQPGIRKTENGREARSLIVDYRGIKIETHLVKD